MLPPPHRIAFAGAAVNSHLDRSCRAAMLLSAISQAAKAVAYLQPAAPQRVTTKTASSAALIMSVIAKKVAPHIL